MLQHIRLLILDLDYVVFDCAPLKVQALRRSLTSLADAIPQNVRLPDAEDAEEGFRDHGSRWVGHLEMGLGEEDLERLQHVYDLNERRMVETGVGRVFPGFHEFLAKCRSMDVSLALGAEAGRDYLVSVAERHQLENCFALSLCTEEFGTGGAGEMIEEIMHHAEVNPSETVVLGTRPLFFQAARDMGVRTVGCGWGIRQHQSLSEADLLCLALSQLSSVVRKADSLASHYS